MHRPRIGLYGVLEKTEQGWERAGELITTVEDQLRQAGMEPLTAPEPVGDRSSALKASRVFSEEDVDLLVAVIVTWSFDNLTLDILGQCDVPLAILAVPGIRSGSLVGAQQLGCVLAETGKEHGVFFGHPDAASTYGPLASYARAAAARRRLARGRIGFIGRRTPGMTPIAFDEMEILERFGAQVVTYGWDEIELEAGHVARAEADATVKRIRSLAGTVSSSDESLYDTAGLYHALRSKVDGDGLTTVCLGCYPHYAGRVCVAAALLGDDGIAAPCEGDVNAGIAMWLLQALTGAPVHFGEMLDIDWENNSIVTSHCGCCPGSLAPGRESVVVGPVRIFGTGSAIRFPAKGGPATYVNLVGRRGTYRLCAAEGEAIPVSMVFEGNPVAFKPDTPVDRLLATAHANGFGHHWMMGYGRVARELASFCAMTGVRGIFPGRERQ